MTDETEATEAEQVETPEVEIPTAEELYDDVDPVEAKAEEPAPKEEKAEEPEETEAEKGDKEEVEATPAPVPTPEEQIAALTKQVEGLTGAAVAERKKRQEVQAEAEKADPIDPIDDPVAYRKDILDEAREEMNNVKWGLIKSDFNNRNPDHKDIEDKFSELMKEKPELATKAQRLAAADPDANPLDFVLQVMKEDEKSSEGSIDVEALTAKITAEVTAKFNTAEKEAKVDEVKKNIPDDLSGEPSRGERKAAAFSEPTADELYN